MTIAVPVSWHEGSTMPAETFAFFRSSSATKRSFADGLGIVEDRGELGEMAGAQQVRDVAHRRRGEQAQRLGRHLQHAAAGDLDRLDVLGGQAAVGHARLVRVLEDRLELSVGRRLGGARGSGHRASRSWARRPGRPARAGP